MSLDFFDVVGSFAQGVNKGAKEADLAIIERMKELDGKTGSDTVKTKYTEEYKKYIADKDLIRQIESAGGPGTAKGQQLLGGHENIEEYMKAVTMQPDLYHPMIFAGEEPVYTPAQYGLTNVRDDGSTITTSGRIFNKFFRPEVFAKNEAEAAASVDVAESTTTYRRKDKTRTPEAIAESKTSLAEAHRLYNHSKKEKKLEVITSAEGGGYEKTVYVPTPDGTTGTGVDIKNNPALEGYQILSTEPWDDPADANKGTTFEYTVNRWLTPDGEIAANNKSGENTPISVKMEAIKTNNPADSITTAVGTQLPQYRILGQEIVYPTEAAEDKGTADMQNQAERINWLQNDYELRPTKWDALIASMDYPEGTKMTDHIANTIAIVMEDLQLSNADGRLVSKLDEYINGNLITTEEIQDEESLSHRTIGVKEAQIFAKRYLDEQDYYGILEDSDYYRAYFENQILFFANKYKTNLPTASNVVSKILQTAITNQEGDSWLEKTWLGIQKKVGADTTTFDETTVIWSDGGRDFTVADIIAGIGAQKNKKGNEGKSWGQLTDDLLANFKKAKIKKSCEGGNAEACELLKTL